MRSFKGQEKYGFEMSVIKTRYGAQLVTFVNKEKKIQSSSSRCGWMVVSFGVMLFIMQ